MKWPSALSVNCPHPLSRTRVSEAKPRTHLAIFYLVYGGGLKLDEFLKNIERKKMSKFETGSKPETGKIHQNGLNSGKIIKKTIYAWSCLFKNDP